MALAAVRRNVLIVSTDPAHNLSDAFDQRFSSVATPVTGFSNLFCLEIDSSKLDEDALASAGDASGAAAGALSGFTKNIPGMDEVMGFITVMKMAQSATYSTVVFDTAPTGHTLKLLAMPKVRRR